MDAMTGDTPKISTKTTKTVTWVTVAAPPVATNLNTLWLSRRDHACGLFGASKAEHRESRKQVIGEQRPALHVVKPSQRRVHRRGVLAQRAVRRCVAFTLQSSLS